MHDIPKKQAQTYWLIRSQPFSKDTYPNLRQATFQRIHRLNDFHFQQTYPRGTEWQEQLFRLFKLASEKVEG